MKLMPDTGRAMAAAFKADRARQTAELALPRQGQRVTYAVRDETHHGSERNPPYIRDHCDYCREAEANQRARACPCTRCNGDHPAAVCPRQAAAGRRPRVSDRHTPP